MTIILILSLNQIPKLILRHNPDLHVHLLQEPVPQTDSDVLLTPSLISHSSDLQLDPNTAPDLVCDPDQYLELDSEVALNLYISPTFTLFLKPSFALSLSLHLMLTLKP